MGEALAEARAAVSRGERAHAAVAVLDEAMVARGHDRVIETNDPTAHAVIVALREASRRLGTARLQGVTIFSTIEPCAMCVGALLNSDVDALVYAAPIGGRRRRQRPPAGRAPGSRQPLEDRQRHPARRGRRALRLSDQGGLNRTPDILRRGEVSEWLMVPLSKSGVRKHRGFESHPLRQRSPRGCALRALGAPLPSLTDV